MHADPFMLSKIGKYHVEEKVASVYYYLVRDTKSYPVLEEWTDKKVKRTWFLPDKTVQVDSMKAEVPDFSKLKVDRVEEREHHLGCLPIVEMRNKQKWIYELLSPWSWKPQLATWYPVRGLITMFYHTLRQIWKNMIIVKPKIIGDYHPQDLARIIAAGGDMAEVLDDMIIKLKSRGPVTDKGGNANLEIMQGDLNIREWFEGAKEEYNFILSGVGLSPINDSSSMKTTSEIYVNQQTSSETLNLLRQLRADQWTRIHDKALIIAGLWNGEGERPYTLSIPEEENLNKALELEEARGRIEANISNYITEIAKIHGVSKKEAEKILQENIKINKQTFEATKEMNQLEQKETKASKVSKDD